MKHIFIINPKAGKNSQEEFIRNFVEAYHEKLDYEIYVTKHTGDAERAAKEFVEKYQTDIRLYACGGDGTLHEVTNGVGPYRSVEVACFACGSGNDFVKNFHNLEIFRDLGRLIRGKAKHIDLMKVDDEYSINITNYGFDGEVTAKMLSYKRLPGISGPAAYKIAAVNSLLFRLNTYLKLTIDDEVIHDGKGLLCAIANGYCYGGGFYCAPKAEIDDGIIDVCFIKKISRFKAAGLMKCYRKGKHLEDKRLKDTVVYRKGRHVIIESDHLVAYAIDGEVKRSKRVEALILPSSFLFVIPEA